MVPVFFQQLMFAPLSSFMSSWMNSMTPVLRIKRQADGTQKIRIYVQFWQLQVVKVKSQSPPPTSQIRKYFPRGLDHSLPSSQSKPPFLPLSSPIIASLSSDPGRWHSEFQGLSLHFSLLLAHISPFLPSPLKKYIPKS
jgi:hypothetical protein